MGDANRPSEPRAGGRRRGLPADDRRKTASGRSRDGAGHDGAEGARRARRAAPGRGTAGARLGPDQGGGGGSGGGPEPGDRRRRRYFRRDRGAARGRGTRPGAGRGESAGARRAQLRPSAVDHPDRALSAVAQGGCHPRGRQPPLDAAPQLECPPRPDHHPDRHRSDRAEAGRASADRHRRRCESGACGAARRAHADRLQPSVARGRDPGRDGRHAGAPRTRRSGRRWLI